MKIFSKIKSQSGVIAILVIFGVSAVALAITSSLAVLAIGENRMANYGGSLEQTFYSAESGLNEALYRLITEPTAGSSTIVIGDFTIDITTTLNPENPYQRIIQSRATSPTGKVRIVQITANTNSFGAGFDYAVQGGTGGIFLDNNSLVTGDAYSNGSILPASGGATGNINGNAWVADFNKIRKVNVSGEVRANTIERSDILENAYYTNIDAQTDVNGSACPNPNCFPASPNPGPKTFPIDDGDVQNWKDDITDTGDPTLFADPSTCSVSIPAGFYCVESNATLGNQKIDANFYLGNGASLTLDGNVWITGDVILDNNGTIKNDSGLGGGSTVIISDGIVDVNNNYIIEGSGDPRSFVLMLSMSTSTIVTAPAIYAANNSDSIVFAALKGMLKVKNNGRLNAACADTLYLEPNSEVVYNPLLMAFTIPSGGGDEIGAALGTWSEL